MSRMFDCKWYDIMYNDEKILHEKTNFLKLINSRYKYKLTIS